MQKYITLIALLFLTSSRTFSQEHPYVPESDPLVLENLEKWKDLKFGLLMHWGPYSQWGIVESWSICSEDEPWCTRKMKNYIDYCREYEKLKNTFNPAGFDPDRWARAAKAAGMKYVVFTTKHHDGFCMFDTKQTDYKVTDPGCPFHADPRSNIALEIFNAFRKEGFLTGAYFSKPDWHSNDYWAEEWATPNRNQNYSIEKYPDRWKRFCDFTYNQIQELMTGYGRIDILWLDGGWVAVENGQDINMPAIAAMARRHQPGLIIVDRAVGGIYENYRTPEQHIPGMVLEYPWETCMTMAGSWSYVPGDSYKPAEKIIHQLVDIVSKGGNYLLNIGPGPDGNWHDEAYTRLQEIGEWMKINGEGIYGTRAITPNGFQNMRFTAKPDGTIYIFRLSDAGETVLPASIYVEGFQPSPGSEISMVGSKGKLQWKTEGIGFRISIPQAQRKIAPQSYTCTFKVKMNNLDR